MLFALLLTPYQGGGPDQYDLPSPSTHGAVELPADSKPDTKTNGNAHHDEDQRFIERTGWAPRFGQGDLTEEEANASLLDHQTFLEGKIDEKFFGGRFMDYQA